MRGVDFSETSRFSGGGGDNGGSFISLPTLRNLGIINHDLSQFRGYLETSKVNPIKPFYIGLHLIQWGKCLNMQCPGIENNLRW